MQSSFIVPLPVNSLYTYVFRLTVTYSTFFKQVNVASFRVITKKKKLCLFVSFCPVRSCLPSDFSMTPGRCSCDTFCPGHRRKLLCLCGGRWYTPRCCPGTLCLPLKMLDSGLPQESSTKRTTKAKFGVKQERISFSFAR